MLQAVIVDDEELPAKRLRRLLSESGGVDICRTFLNPWEAVAYVKQHPVDIAFLDISMPELNGIQLSGLLRESNPSIGLVFTTGYDEYAARAFDLDALDYLVKPLTAERVAQMVDKLRRRYRFEAVEPSEDAQQPRPLLTDRELLIVRMMASGWSNKEIAIRLDISAETVKSHVKNIFRKLNVNNRIQALQRAKELNLLP